MHITLVTPAAPGSRAGNRATAERWATFLRELGQSVTIDTDYNGEQTDLLLALHAWRSAKAVRAWRERFPQGPLIVALTGTDLYHFQQADPEPTRATMEAADVLIGLHDRVARVLPPALHRKLSIVHQSAPALEPEPGAVADTFDVCVIGHLREEKDSLRAAYAVRDLPSSSRLRVMALGRAHNDDWAQQARAEMTQNPRYHWLDEQPRAEVRRVMAHSQAMVISSRMEGGANVVSEACVAGLPVIASDIDGNIGLLGEDYLGYFRTEDTQSLQAALLRAEQDPQWLRTLQQQVSALAPRFRPEREREALARALTRFMAAEVEPK